MMTAASVTTTTKRRNGQLSSCEPCRKAKLRCDHATPICGRCLQRGQQSTCIYHPAPMTQPREDKPILKKKRIREPSILTEKGITSTNFLQRYRVHHDPRPLAASKTDQKGQVAAAPDEEPLSLKASFSSTGFLGPSSFWAAFDEPDEPRSSTATYTTPTQSSRYTESPPATDTIAESTTADMDQIECGARILVLLEDLSLYQKLVQHRFTMLEPEPWVFGPRLANETFAAVYSLRQEWRQGTKLSQNKLLTWSEQLFENSAKPITTHPSMTMTEYFSSIAARWETIGLLFSWVAVTSLMIPENHEVLRSDDDGSVINIHKLRELAADVSEICLGFCESIGTLSDPLVWLLLQRTIVLGEVHGDSDYRPWKKLGDLSTTIFALGLHCPKPDPSTPLFLRQIRLRAMTAAFSADKQLATLLGRPPRIAWQYCDIEYPLDLSYEEVCAVSEGKDHVLQKIGPDGWNLEGRVNSGTRGRINLMLAIIREKILALSLSPHSEDLVQRISDTCDEHDQIRKNLPPKLQWTPPAMRKKEAGYNLPPPPSEFLETLHLEFLHNEFIIYSVVVRRTGEYKDRFIQAARKMLSELLLIVSSRHPDSCESYRSSWDLCYLGLPCAGVLAQELLQRSQRKCRGTATTTTPFPRSEIVQNLSVFASLLESALHTRDGNSGVARRGLDAIRNILDRVLSGDEEVFTSAPPAPTTIHPHNNNNNNHHHQQPAPSPLLIPLPSHQAPGSLASAQQQSAMPEPAIATTDNNSSTDLSVGAGAEYNPDDGILSQDLMAWLDNFDWAQESLLTYS